MTTEFLEKLEIDINAELYRRAEEQNSVHDPITDGVVDPALYLESSPRMLWILKEPWEKLREGEAGGGWSVTQDLVRKGVKENRGTYAPMAYVAYSVYNGYPKYLDIPYVSDEPAVGEALKRTAYINVNKYPGKTRSNPSEIAACYRLNRDILLRQVDAIEPDVIIGGATLHLFHSDFGLTPSMFDWDRSAAFCKINKRLYIQAYHPSQRSIGADLYVDDIVEIIHEHFKRRGRATRKSSS